jgi:hypothetical protein
MATVSRLKTAYQRNRQPQVSLNMWVDPALKAAAQDAADAAGQTLTTWVQRTMAAALGRKPPPVMTRGRPRL